jgi:hypothetical protein
LKPKLTSTEQLLIGVSVSEMGTPATKSLSLGFSGAFAAVRTRLAARQKLVES